MKKMYKAALLAVLGISAVSSAQAAFTVNDLYLGFTESGATSDLILDLGQASTLVGQTSVVDLSSQFASAMSTFNSTFNSSATGVNMAVVGGDNKAGQFGVFATQLRVGGPGVASVAGSSIASTHSSSQMSGGAGQVAAIMANEVGGLPTSGNYLTIAAGNSDSFTSVADKTGVANNFIGKTGVNPASQIGSSDIIYEDLYAATTASAYTYEGYFTFNDNTDSLTFTSAVSAVPEPASYGLMAGAGLLLVTLRRQFVRKNA